MTRKLWTPHRSVVMPRPWFKQRGFFVPAALHYPNFKVDSADFDGTNDEMARGGGLTGAVDSKSGVLVAWVRLDGGNGIAIGIFAADSAGVLYLRRNAANVFSLACTGVGTLTGTTVYTAGSNWICVMASWDNAAGVAALYVNEVLEASAVPANVLINYATGRTNWFVGCAAAGTNRFNGCLAELYFAPGQYIDFSAVANRRKFISGGKPVSLGVDGSRPTGTAALVYSHLDDGEAVANFATNRGTGGNFTITGTLDTGSTSPSD